MPARASCCQHRGCCRQHATRRRARACSPGRLSPQRDEVVVVARRGLVAHPEVQVAEHGLFALRLRDILALGGQQHAARLRRLERKQQLRRQLLARQPPHSVAHGGAQLPVGGVEAQAADVRRQRAGVVAHGSTRSAETEPRLVPLRRQLASALGVVRGRRVPPRTQVGERPVAEQLGIPLATGAERQALRVAVQARVVRAQPRRQSAGARAGGATCAAHRSAARPWLLSRMAASACAFKCSAFMALLHIRNARHRVKGAAASAGRARGC
jgi:hypothetical protein